MTRSDEELIDLKPADHIADGVCPWPVSGPNANGGHGPFKVIRSILAKCPAQSRDTEGTSINGQDQEAGIGSGPFAPSVLREKFRASSDQDIVEARFLMHVVLSSSQKWAKSIFLAVVKCRWDGPAPAVDEENNPRYYRLIQALKERTRAMASC